MTARTWKNGPNNSAANPGNWTPTGAPQPGDVLQISNLTTTMNVRGNDLAGDTLTIYGTTLTANLSHATMSLTLPSTWHMAPNAATLNLLSGTNTLTLNDAAAPVAVNIAAGARWNGTMTVGANWGADFASVTVSGPGNWNNNGASEIYSKGSAVVKADVVGTGSFHLEAASVFAPMALPRLEFMGSVGAGQSITDAGLLVLDKPQQFSGHVTLAGAGSEIDLTGLANADSYTFQNDMLRIWSGATVIDRLHLTDQSPHGFLIDKIPASPGSFNLTAITDLAHVPVAMLDNALPLHVA